MSSKALKTKVTRSKTRVKASAKTTSKKAAPKHKKVKLKTSRPHPLRGSSRMTAMEVGRTRHFSRFDRNIAYYAMGAFALGIGVLYWAYQDTRDHQSVSYSSISPPEVQQEKPEQKTEQKITGPLESEFKEVQGLDLKKKIEFWSSYLEKSPENNKKLLDLVKSESVSDSAPLVPQEYNCTTFVETVAALARSQNPDDFVRNLLSIRYKDSQARFESRNHFPEADWIPNNEKAQNLRDFTADVAKQMGIEVQIEKKQINRGKWLQAQMRRQGGGRALASATSKEWAKEWLSSVEAKVSYIGISNIEALKQIPSGTILNLVHKNDSRHPVLIAHQGFVIRRGDEVLFRHATVGGEIRTNDLKTYLQNLVRHEKSNTRWPLIGVNLNQIND